MNKFSHGELVILQSKSEPSKNGEYYVNDVKLTPRCRINNSDGEILKDVYIYQLDDVESESGWWLEDALRKKQEPSEFSFTELMEGLKNPVTEKN